MGKKTLQIAPSFTELRALMVSPLQLALFVGIAGLI
jgi:hypothetical protein